MMKADERQEITSQIDLASRRLAGDKLDHTHCYLEAEKTAEWKN